MKKYKYGLQWWIIIIGIPLFSIGIPVFYSKASNNRQGLIINNLVELSPSSASLFYWFVFVFTILISGILVFSGYLKIKHPVYILIDSEKIIIPPIGFFQKSPSNILFCEIDSIYEQTISRNTMLKINYQNKTSVIQKNMLKKTEYEEIKNLLAVKINHQSTI